MWVAGSACALLMYVNACAKLPVSGAGAPGFCLADSAPSRPRRRCLFSQYVPGGKQLVTGHSMIALSGAVASWQACSLSQWHCTACCVLPTSWLALMLHPVNAVPGDVNCNGQQQSVLRWLNVPHSVCTQAMITS